MLALGGWLALQRHDQLGHVPGVHHLPGRSSSGPRGCSPPAGPRRSWRGPASSGCYELIDSQPDVVDPDAPGASLPDGPLAVELDDVTFGYARSEPVLDGVSPARRAGRDARAGRGRRARASRPSRCCCPASTTRSRARVRVGGVDVRDAAAGSICAARGRGVRGGVPVLRHHRGQHRLRPPGRHRRGDPGRGRGRRRPHEFISALPRATTPWSASAG